MTPNLHLGRSCNGSPCSLCEKGATNRALRDHWIAQLGITEEEAEKITPWQGKQHRRSSPFCKHLGKLTGERVNCKTCPGTAAVHDCAVHGKCTIVRNTDGVPFCHGGCDKFEPREAARIIDLAGTAETDYCRGLGDALTWAWIATGATQPLAFAARGQQRKMLELFGQTIVKEGGVNPAGGHVLEMREKFRRPRWQVWQEFCGIHGTPKRPPLPCEVKPVPNRIALAPECEYPRRTWPRHLWDELAFCLENANYEVLWVKKENRWSLAEVAENIATCSLLVGNDSMPAHMAGTLGVPALVLFGLTRPTVLAHYGDLIHPIDMGRHIERIPVQAVFDKAVALARPDYTEAMMAKTFSEWEPWVAPFIPQTGKHALDIGGNVGQWARGLAQRFQRVTCLEPTPALAKRIADMALPNVAVLEKAAWISSGVLPFQVYGDTPHGYGIWSTVSGVRDRAEGGAQEITVEGVAIDALGLDVDFIKVDVEGAEVPVLMGAAKTIERCKPQVLIECHEPEHYAWCVAFLDRLGYNVTSINGPGYAPGTKDWAAHRWLFGKQYKCR